MNELIELHLAQCRRRGLADRTIDDRRKLLCRLDRELPVGINAATEDELASALLREDWSRSTRSVYCTHVREYFAWAFTTGEIDYDPASTLPKVRVPQGVPRPASLEEVNVALRELDNPWRLAVILATYGGLRCCEVAPLLREDVTEDGIILRRRKGGKASILPTHPTIWANIRTLPPGYVIRRHGSRPPTPHWLSSKLALELDDIGLGHLGGHSFRHTFGTELYRRTKDLRVTQELMGHASPNTTSVYTLISGEERRMAISTLPAPASASA